MTYPILKFSQPAGDFFLTSMPASDVIRIAVADPRRYDPDAQGTAGGIHRVLSKSRVSEIARYCNTVDAAFPTAIILAVQQRDYKLNSTESRIEFLPAASFANIVDGQHRIIALKK